LQIHSESSRYRIHHHILVDERILADHGTYNGDIHPTQFANREIVALDRFKLNGFTTLYHRRFRL